jgi:hypothetical protein
MLTDFFRINMPYGMRRNSNNKWFFFNREYLPLGWNDKHASKEDADLPIHTRYTGLTENTLLKLSWNGEDSVKRDASGVIKEVFFYNDRTNPQNDSKYWGDYFDKIKQLSKSNVKSEQFA